MFRKITSYKDNKFQRQQTQRQVYCVILNVCVFSTHAIMTVEFTSCLQLNSLSGYSVQRNLRVTDQALFGCTLVLTSKYY